MAYLSIVLIALGVSADAFAVALGRGLKMRTLLIRDAALIAVTFGVFQAVMPLIGWLLGSQVGQFIAPVDHWVAFALLAAVGIKLLWEAFHEGDDGKDGRLGIRELLVLAVATSIDALAVGIGLAFLDIPIVPAVIIIGIVTTVLSFAGVYIGHRAGVKWRKPAEIVGGLVLIGIGVKIVIDHTIGG